MAHIVAAVDGSAHGARAADWAVDEADRRQVPLRLVCASLWERCEPGPPDDVVARLQDAVHRTLAAEAARLSMRRPGVRLSTHLLPEEIVPALLRAGRGAEMLVLGSRGHGGFEGLLLGSVSLRVAARADFPVVVVHDRSTSEAAGRIVLGIGGHQLPGPAADFALAEAAVRKAELDVTHAWQPSLDFSGLSALMDPSPALERAEALLTAVADPLEHSGTGVRVRLCVPGGAASALLDAASGADLLVVGSRRSFGQLGPVTHAVLHHAPCPVAVIPT